MKINASYFEFQSTSSLHASDGIWSRNISRGPDRIFAVSLGIACDFQYPNLKSDIAGISRYRKFEALIITEMSLHAYYAGISFRIIGVFFKPGIMDKSENKLNR
jgi:hypothetical protein